MLRELLRDDARTRVARCLLASTAMLCAAIVPVLADAPRGPAARPEAPEMQVLFVQSAKGVVIDTQERTLTLTGMLPETLFFADRPARDTGRLSTAEFLQLWGEGEDSFRVHPPNATLSVLLEGHEQPANTVVTLKNPRRKGSDLVYDFVLLDGNLPARSGPASLFIDILGVRRRTAVVAYSAGAHTAEAASASAAQQQQAAAQQQAAQAASAQSAAAAQQAAAAAQQAAAAANKAATPAAPAKSPEQQLQDLKSLYDKGLISESDYNTAKAKILAQLEK